MPSASASSNNAPPRLTVVGTTWCKDTTQQRIALLENGIKYRFINNDVTPVVPKSTWYPLLVCGGKGHAGEMDIAEVRRFCPGA